MIPGAAVVSRCRSYVVVLVSAQVVRCSIIAHVDSHSWLIYDRVVDYKKNSEDAERARPPSAEQHERVAD